MGTCVHSGVLTLIRCLPSFLLFQTRRSLSDSNHTSHRCRAGAGCMHARSARALAHTLRAHAPARPPRDGLSPAPPLCCPYRQSSHRGPPSPRTGCHVSSDALVSAWRSRHSVMCIRGLALPPPALAFLCPSPPLALGAFCPACGQAVGEPVPPADTHGN